MATLVPIGKYALKPTIINVTKQLDGAENWGDYGEQVSGTVVSVDAVEEFHFTADPDDFLDAYVKASETSTLTGTFRSP